MTLAATTTEAKDAVITPTNGCDVYKKTYFRLDAGYVWGKGMDDAAYFRFQEEVVGLLEEVGFVPLTPALVGVRRGECVTVGRSKEWLYLHPMDLSGMLRDGTAAQIEPGLRSAESFRLRAIDTFACQIDYDGPSLQRALDEQFLGLRDYIYRVFATRQRRFWYRDSRSSEAFHYLVKRLAPFGDRHDQLLPAHRDILAAGVDRAITEMIAEGYLLRTQEHEKVLYRAANKTELRRAGLMPLSTVRRESPR